MKGDTKCGKWGGLGQLGVTGNSTICYVAWDPISIIQ